MWHELAYFAIGMVGGALGSVVGLGGGVFIIPVLVLFFKVPIQTAVSASLVAVVATSSTAAAAYLREDLTNVKLGMTLETMTVLGALTGGLTGAFVGRNVLSLVFGVVMCCVSLYMALQRRTESSALLSVEDTGLLGACYFDRTLSCTVSYRPRRLGVGLVASLVAGHVSGLLGVGGGFLKVPVMVLAMKVPVRAAVCTSSFMIGVTACAGALVYFARGLVDPIVAVPVVFGVTIGAFAGARVGLRVRSSVLTVALAGVLFILSVQMILAAFGMSVR